MGLVAKNATIKMEGFGVFFKERDEDIVMAFINMKKMQLRSSEQSVKNKTKASSLITRNHFCMRPFYVTV